MDQKELSSAAEETANIQKAIEKIADNERAELADDSSMPVTLQEEKAKEPSLPANAAGSSDTKVLPELSSAPKASIPPTMAPSENDTPVHRWFFTFMCMNIPIIGWIYLLFLAFSKKYPERKSFARAYLFYKLIFLSVSVLILGVLIYIGLDLLDQLLAYMEML